MWEVTSLHPSPPCPVLMALQTKSPDLVLQLPCRDDHPWGQGRLQRDAKDSLCDTEAGFDALELNITAQSEFVLEAWWSHPQGQRKAEGTDTVHPPTILIERKSKRNIMLLFTELKIHLRTLWITQKSYTLVWTGKIWDFPRHYLWTNRCHKVHSFSITCFLLPHPQEEMDVQLRQQPQRINWSCLLRKYFQRNNWSLIRKHALRNYVPSMN